MIDPKPDEILRVHPGRDLVRFIEWESGASELRIARCEHSDGSIELYMPEQLRATSFSGAGRALLDELTQMSQDLGGGYR